MRLNIGKFSILAAGVILALVVACGTTTPTVTNPNPANQPPTPTPIPPEAKQTAQDFAQAHGLIEQDWDQFHTTFDQWRAGLTSCDSGAAQTSLRGFASDIGEITQQAHILPRASSTRRLADQLIKAAENEEAGLRQLRSRWQPDSTALFEAVDSARSESLASQKAVADDLDDLSEPTSEDDLEDVREFSTEFESVSNDWTSLHNAFDSVREGQDMLTNTESSIQLADVIDDLKNVQSAIANLPSSEITKGMIDDLKSASEAEEDVLTTLKESFDSQVSSEEGSDEPSFTDADAKVSDVDDVRDQLDDELQSILDDSSSDKLADIDAFQQEYDLLIPNWAAFHNDYNEWRLTEGGCNRVEVAKRLGKFALSFGDISKQVNNLPQSSFLRPMGDSLVDAAQREEEALRILRNSWRPFSNDAYRALDQERNNAGRLRRQANVGVQELLQRFGISPGGI